MGLRDEVAPLILFLIREGEAQTLSTLVRELSERYELSLAPAYRICSDIVNALQDAGLVTSQEEGEEGKYVATELVGKVQAALGISLSHLSKPSARALVVTPVFGVPDAYRPSPDVFVLMPFTAKMRPIYDDHIKKVCTDLDLTVARADDFFSTQSVIDEIWSAINKSSILIADCTGRNPNVFYEIGIAHTVGRKVILLSQQKDDMPFDLAHIRRISYSFTPRGMTEMEDALRKTLKTELGLEDE
jgi:hypothetical protein